MWLCKSDVMSDIMSCDDKGRHYGMQNDWKVSLNTQWHFSLLMKSSSISPLPVFRSNGKLLGGTL
jgi:hypothetical protein